MLRLSSSRPRNGLQGRTVATTASIDPSAPVYEPHWTLREARDRHFAIGGFSEDQYAARFVRFRIGKKSVWLPNSPGRTRALPYHDLHHVLTAYPTSWRGEVEIAAWELASGCRDYLTVWVINLGALAIGLVLAPTSAFRAFVRGRHSDNLYGDRHRSVVRQSRGRRPRATEARRRHSPRAVARCRAVRRDGSCRRYARHEPRARGCRLACAALTALASRAGPAFSVVFLSSLTIGTSHAGFHAPSSQLPRRACRRHRLLG